MTSAPPAAAAIAHLYRRAGFGLTSTELDAAVLRGFDACVEELLAGLAGPPAVPVPQPKLTGIAEQNSHTDLGDEFLTLVNWWVDTMVTTPTPLREKLVLLLHSQFPTAIYKVNWPSMMHNQNQIFRIHGPGAFDQLVQLVAKDPAMLVWLDADTDQKQAPNENFARELMERFTIGIGNYTQQDVREGARCFAGWSIAQATGQFQYQPFEADLGWKTFLGHQGQLTGEDVIQIVTHNPYCAPFVTARLWSWLAYPVEVFDPVVNDLAPGFAADLDLGKLVAAMLRHPAFVSDRALNGLVKQPVEFLVGTMRRFGMTTSRFGDPGAVDNLLASLGQELFNPPNVGGWGLNGYWLSTATSLSRLDFATQVAESADLSNLESVPVSDRHSWLATVLGVGSWSETTLRALGYVADNPVQLLTLALVSPEYCVN